MHEPTGVPERGTNGLAGDLVVAEHSRDVAVLGATLPEDERALERARERFAVLGSFERLVLENPNRPLDLLDQVMEQREAARREIARLEIAQVRVAAAHRLEHQRVVFAQLLEELNELQERTVRLAGYATDAIQQQGLAPPAGPQGSPSSPRPPATDPDASAR